MRKVEILRSEVINQIAAGEVLESPASAVKELVENAIDAGARSVRVEIKGGGHQLIRVEDDGEGMGREDAVACLERHATSKIREADDLWMLSTMGFRGEALAAIASVSQMEIETSNGEEGSLVRVEAGRVERVESLARNRGTTIDVKVLFYNVPARQKFQKSAAASGAQVLKVMQSLALAHFGVGFRFISQERDVFRIDGGDWRKRVEEVLGKLAHEVKGEKQGASLYGMVGGLEETKGNRSGQHVFVNRRPVFSPLIAKAVKDAYGTRIAEGKYPCFALFLELAPDEVDVNVHPQKKDVRFRDESKIYRLVHRAVIEGLGGAEEEGFSRPLVFPKEVLPWDILPNETKEIEKEPFFHQLNIPMQGKKRVAFLIGGFALFEADPFVLLDLKGAEARILFENMKKEQPAVQGLLIPFEIELAWGEALQGDYWVEELKKIGIEARMLGDKMLAIDALPLGLEAEEIEEFFNEWKSERKLASTICRLCRARKKMYTAEEAAFLEQKLTDCSDRTHDPLGRIIYKEVREEQIKKWLTDGP